MWQGIRGLCDHCRQLLCDDKPFNCNAQSNHDHDGWVCTSCFDARAEAKRSDQAARNPRLECTFSRKPTPAQKSAWRIFENSKPEDPRASAGNHLQPRHPIPEKDDEEKALEPTPTVGVAPDVPAPRPFPESSEWGLFASHRPPTPPDSPQVYQRAVIPQNSIANSLHDDRKPNTLLQAQPNLEHSLINTTSEPFASKDLVRQEAQDVGISVASSESQIEQIDRERCANANTFDIISPDKTETVNSDNVPGRIAVPTRSDDPQDVLPDVQPSGNLESSFDNHGHVGGSAEDPDYSVNPTHIGHEAVNEASPVPKRKRQSEDRRSLVPSVECERTSVPVSASLTLASTPALVAKRKSLRPTTLSPKDYYPDFLVDYADHPSKRAKKFHASSYIHDTASEIELPRQVLCCDDKGEIDSFHDDIEVSGNSAVEGQGIGNLAVEPAACSEAHQAASITGIGLGSSGLPASDVNVDICMIDAVPISGQGLQIEEGVTNETLTVAPSDKVQFFSSAVQNLPPASKPTSEVVDAPALEEISEVMDAKKSAVVSPSFASTPEPALEQSDTLQPSEEVQSYSRDDEGVQDGSFHPRSPEEPVHLSEIVTPTKCEDTSLAQSISRSTTTPDADAASVSMNVHVTSRPSESQCEVPQVSQTPPASNVTEPSEDVSEALAKPALDGHRDHTIATRASSHSPRLVEEHSNEILDGLVKIGELSDWSMSPAKILMGVSIPSSWRAVPKTGSPQQAGTDAEQDISPSAHKTKNVGVFDVKLADHHSPSSSTSSDLEGSAAVSVINAAVGSKAQISLKSGSLDAPEDQNLNSPTRSLRWVSENISKTDRPRQVHEPTSERKRRTVARPCKRCNESGDICDQVRPTCKSCRDQGTYCDYPRRKFQRSCELCRHRKTTCDKAKPVCRQCERSGINCVYPVAARSSVTKSKSFLQDEDCNKLESWSPFQKSKSGPAPTFKKAQLDSKYNLPTSQDESPLHYGHRYDKDQDYGHDACSIMDQRQRLSELAEKIKGSSLYTVDNAKPRAFPLSSSVFDRSELLDRAHSCEHPTPQPPRSQKNLEQIPAAGKKRLSDTTPRNPGDLPQHQERPSPATKLESIVPLMEHPEHYASTPMEPVHRLPAATASPGVKYWPHQRKSSNEMDGNETATAEREIIDLTQPKALSFSIESLLNGSMVEPKRTQYRNPLSRSRSVSRHSGRPNSSSGAMRYPGNRSDLESRPRIQQGHSLPRTPSPLRQQYRETHLSNNVTSQKPYEPYSQTALMSAREREQKTLSTLTPQQYLYEPNPQAGLRPPPNRGPPAHSRTGSMPHQYREPISPTAPAIQRQREWSLPPRITPQQQQPQLDRHSPPLRLPSVICAESEAAYKAGSPRLPFIQTYLPL